MWDPYALEQHVRLRQADELRRAERARLVRLAVEGARARRPTPALHLRLLYRLGALLVAWGSRLQAYAEGPELERQLTPQPAAPPRHFAGGTVVPAVYFGPDGPFGAFGPDGPLSPTADSPSRS